MASSLLHTIHLRFNRALIVVRSIPEHEVGLQPIPMDRLKFYGLYKQATVGECNTPKPSSRNVVEYAKWKAWYRVRHLNSMEAQNLYVNALVELLVDFINRYPNSQYIEFAKEALCSLESDLSAGTDMEKDDRHDAWEPTSFLDDGHDPLTHIEPDHLANYTHLVTSPTTSSFFANGSLASNTPSLHASTTPSSVTHANDPQTPLLLPHQQQQYQQHSHYYDLQKWSTSPSRTRLTNNNKQTTLISSPSLSSSESYSHSPPQDDNRLSERTLENLQTEVTALTEQMDRLRQELKDKEIMKRGLGLGWLLRTLVKHILANSLIAGIFFWILWRRQSPLAVALVNHFTPQIEAWMRSMVRATVRKVMFWKLTV